MCTCLYACTMDNDNIFNSSEEEVLLKALDEVEGLIIPNSTIEIFLRAVKTFDEFRS